MRVAIVHYWLIGMRGGEQVVEALCRRFPEADIFTHVYDPDAVSPVIRQHQVHTTFIQRLPRAVQWYQRYLPLMPLALERLDLRDYDLVISSESGPAKGIIPAPHAVHICYCHSPMRYIWDLRQLYLRRLGRVGRIVAEPIMHYLRMWDVGTAARVDHFVANSRYVQARIEKYYRRSSEVVYPPVDVASCVPTEERDDFYLFLGELAPYKRADLAVAAARQLQRPLVVIGNGVDSRRLRRGAGSGVTFLGRQPKDVVRRYLARCRAVLFPGEEDFGMVPVEAMASGRPVIAYRRGGVLETVIDGQTGILFREQTVDGLTAAIRRFEAMQDHFDASALARHAQAFSREVFARQMAEVIDRVVAERQERAPAQGLV